MPSLKFSDLEEAFDLVNFGGSDQYGAYSRFKALLADREQLDAWFEFEREATRRALIAWARVLEIDLVGLPDDSEA